MAETRYILAGRLIDGSGAALRRKVLIKVEGGLISTLGHPSDLPAGATHDDLSHCTLVPALVDCSVALTKSPSMVEGEETDPATMLVRHINYCHSHGVLGVADHSDTSHLLESGQEEMVDIRLAGRDFLRIAFSADIDNEEAAEPLLSQEELNRILKERGERKAVVVANGPKDIEQALAASCDAIEQGYAMGEDNLRRMAEQNVLWIPSILQAKNGLDNSASGGSVCCRFSTRYVAPGQALPGAEEFWKKMLSEQLKQLRLARELGVQTAIGTGAGNVGILHGEAMVEEMKLFIQAGYTLEETIRCASKTGAQFLGMEQLGTLTPNQPATFLVARGMAKQQPRKLAYLEGIYINGTPSTAYHKNPIQTDPSTSSGSS